MRLGIPNTEFGLGRVLAAGKFLSPELAGSYCLHIYFLFSTPAFSSLSPLWCLSIADLTSWHCEEESYSGSPMRASSWNRSQSKLVHFQKENCCLRAKERGKAQDLLAMLQQKKNQLLVRFQCAIGSPPGLKKLKSLGGNSHRKQLEQSFRGPDPLFFLVFILWVWIHFP